MAAPKSAEDTLERRHCRMCGVSLYKKYTTNLSKKIYENGACLIEKIRVCGACANKYYADKE